VASLSQWGEVLISSDNHLFRVNLDQKNASLLAHIPAATFAYDWIGKKVYWSNPNQQIVSFFPFFVVELLEVK
jgi:hypothetical protein